MRMLVVIPHYFGGPHPTNSSPTIGSYLEPLSRVAALNETIVALHRHFGRWGHDSSGVPISGESTDGPDIVIVTKRGYGILEELGFSPGTFSIEYVDCDPPWLAFQTQRIFRERFGRYDFYCYLEDDLAIHDPAFFEKLTWFQLCFGARTLLQPVRYEMPKSGKPVKCLVDPELPESAYAPFRRPGQLQEITGTWNGRQQIFSLPSNPHSASFFLTAEQMAYWMQQPSFDDGNDTWVGPLESAATYSIGRAFDIYKPLKPDAFFLNVEHFGTRYASSYQSDGFRYGDSPLLAIAQNATQMALEICGSLPSAAASEPSSFSRVVQKSVQMGATTENRGRLDRLECELAAQKRVIEALRRKRAVRVSEVRSLRSLLRLIGKELLRRGRRMNGPGKWLRHFLGKV